MTPEFIMLRTELAVFPPRNSPASFSVIRRFAGASAPRRSSTRTATASAIASANASSFGTACRGFNGITPLVFAGLSRLEHFPKIENPKP